MADIYNFVNYSISLVWIYKIQIVGSIFLSLTIFEYFYRYKLKLKREKQLLTILKLLNSLESIKFDMAKIKDKSRDELEHEFLNTNIEKLAHQIHIDREALVSQLNTNNRILMMQLNTEFEMVNVRIEGFSKMIKGNSEDIKALKHDTKIIRAIREYKYVFGLALIGLIGLTNFKQIEEWVMKMLPFK